MSTYNSVNDRREKLWLKNAFRYCAMRLLPNKRDKTLWVFSAWEGEKYRDNSKYLFDYIRNKHPEIRVIWHTKNKHLYEELIMNQIPVQLIGTKEAEHTQRRAGVAVYTNGLDDFGDNPYIYGAHIVCLWHGVGFKKGYRMLLDETPKTIRFMLGNLKWDIFNWVKRDTTVTTSIYMKTQYMRYFRIKDPSSILICGQARNDAFAKIGSIEDATRSDFIKEKALGKKVILYMPTFRKDSSSLINVIEEMSKSLELQKTLKTMNCVMLCKLHYLCHGDFEQSDSMIFLNDDDVPDVQKLIACADAIMTDYSSAAMDFALLHRPVLFYFPTGKEEEHYFKETMMSEMPEVCGLNCAFGYKQLFQILPSLFDENGKGIIQCEALNEYFDNTKAHPGQYAERTYEAIIERI